jgi:hypothetical protein
MSPRPTVGRMVHYVSHGTPPLADGSQAYKSECRAAVIAAIVDTGYLGTDPRVLEGLPQDLVSLVVLNPEGIFFSDADYDEDGERGGSWHWPERA